MQITLRQIQFFLAATETGQFSAAAAKLHVTQTAVTSGIKELESSLGFSLFHRHHAAGVSLTPEGHHFLPHAHNVASAVRGALNSQLSTSQVAEGQLRVAATHSILGSYLIPTLAAFVRAYPRVEVELLELPRSRLERAVLSQEADVGVAWLSNLEATTRLRTTSLTRSRRQVWLGARHPLLEQSELRLADLAAQPYALYNRDETPRGTARFWRQHGLKPNIRYRITSIEALRSLVAQGLAITILADVAYRPFSQEGLRVEARPISDGLPAIEIGLVQCRSAAPSAAASAFSQYLRAAFGVPPQQ